MEGLAKILEALRGIKVRVKETIRPFTRRAGKTSRAPRKEARPGVRNTLKTRAAELFKAAVGAPRKSDYLRKNINDFRKARTLEAKLKIADKMFKKEEYHNIAVKLYLFISKEALKEPEKYYGIAKELKIRISGIYTECEKSKFKEDRLFKKYILQLEINANTLFRKYSEKNEGIFPKTYVGACKREFEAIKRRSKNGDIARALHNRFKEERSFAAKQRIAYMTATWCDLILAAEFYKENIKGLLDLKIVNAKLLEEIAENYAQLYFINKRFGGSLTEFNEARNLICQKMKEGRFTVKDAAKIENYLRHVYDIPLSNGVRIVRD